MITIARNGFHTLATWEADILIHLWKLPKSTDTMYHFIPWSQSKKKIQISFVFTVMPVKSVSIIVPEFWEFLLHLVSYLFSFFRILYNILFIYQPIYFEVNEVNIHFLHIRPSMLQQEKRLTSFNFLFFCTLLLYGIISRIDFLIMRNYLACPWRWHVR